MNVVGKVGSFITQGVYSVATPFHPFGGAVDVIVVQQQDGTFRSTPWYVRFGKFQGVLKGAEKIVRIEVNGDEAHFHMYLDNSGEAYFVMEVDSGKESDVNGCLKDSDRLEDTRDDSSVNYSHNEDNLSGHDNNDSYTSKVQLQDERKPLGMDRLERTESDSERRFYEFQEEQSFHDGSVDLSECGSSQYENLDSVEQMIESQDSNSEVILVSIDGHILTAPLSSSEENTENVQLSIPQFHLGPGEGTNFCEGNTEFSKGEAAWAVDYLSDLDKSPRLVASEDVCMNNDTCVSERGCEVPETQGTAKQELCMRSNSEDASVCITREDIFRSCVELPELSMQIGNFNQQEIGSQLEIHENLVDSQKKSPHSLLSNDKTEDLGFGESRNNDGLSPLRSNFSSSTISSDLKVELLEKNASVTFHNGSDGMPLCCISNDQEMEGQIGVAQEAEGLRSSPQVPVSEDQCSKSETVEPQTSSSSEDRKDDTSHGFEISLCRNLLHAGMGLSAAAEAFDVHRISEEEFKLSSASIIKNDNLVIRFREMYLPWDKAAPIVLGMAAYALDLPVDPNDAIPVEQDGTKPRKDDSGITSTPSGRRWRLWPIPFRRVKTLEHTSSNSSTEEVFVDSESGSLIQPVEPRVTPCGGGESPHKQLVRTNVPTTEQIASLNLKEGQNMVTFSFSTRVLGMQKVEAHIYLWKWNARIVISDVDGTITKSDVLGQFMPLVGKDWTQSGVTRLFSAIKENGYQLLFLSARAIVQAYLTRSFLLNIKQDGKALPNGPVVISPDGLFPSLYREVIRRAPHEFKIACLEDIKALFPSDYNPFYAGFGNRDTDELSYRKIGIPKGKIFIINPKGEVAINHQIDVKSYTSLHTLVNDMFPPTALVEQEDYNSWNYWKMSLPTTDNL